ncbi:MAG: trimeric intracellular cation channel family protein [Flavobacteriales bacterium]|nr:trimeric intracellular cation channel family protein [Flavobacteriales bacterium]NQX96924.1 trimeric intracellular cation channel family protein [Flavobacteriales bacterium]
METILIYISLLGSLTFAISGALKAINKNFDPFGVLIIGFITAVGGGTIRDMLLTDKTVFWLNESTHLYVILGGVILAIIFRNKLNKFNKHLLFFDAVGLGLFTITGVQIGLENDLHFLNCIILGTITGSFGGVLRDVLVNETPVIFKKEIYATISIVGGAIYLLLLKLEVQNPILQIVPIALIIIARLLILRFNISLPQIKNNIGPP